MIPPRNFPLGVIKLVELDGKKEVKVVAEFSSSAKNRLRVQQMRNDLLMVNPKLNLHIQENNA